MYLCIWFWGLRLSDIWICMCIHIPTEKEEKCSCYYPQWVVSSSIFSDTGELFGKRSLIPAIARNPYSSCSHGSDPSLPFSGPGFGIYAVVHLLLPVMALWLRRSHKDHSYWDVASANFKHAIGLSCELVVEHIQSFLHSGSYSARASPCGHCFCM